MRQVHDELREPDGRPGRGAPLRPEPRHRGLLQQLVQHQGYTVPAGEWGQEEARLAWGPQPMTSGLLELPASRSIPQDGGCIHSPPSPDLWFFPFSSVIGVELLYSVLFISAVPRSEASVCAHLFPPSWTSLPPSGFSV